uniref:Uncharacterized protein n=1 Tax=viral metagenome TaxID=1070528 RepID=A0A6C0I1T8_9ZZZZ
MSILRKIKKIIKKEIEGSVHIALLLAFNTENSFEDMNDDKEDIILKIILRYLQITKNITANTDISSVSSGSVELATSSNMYLYKLANAVLDKLFKCFNSVFQKIATELQICAKKHPDIANSVKSLLPNAPALRSEYKQEIQDESIALLYQTEMQAKSNYNIDLLIMYSKKIIKPRQFYISREYDKLCDEVDIKYAAILKSDKNAKKESEVIFKRQQILSDQIDEYPLDRPNFVVFIMALGALITDYITLGLEEHISFDCGIFINEIIKKYIYLMVECGTLCINMQETALHTKEGALKQKELYKNCIGGELYTTDFKEFIHIVQKKAQKKSNSHMHSEKENAQQRASVFAKETQRIEEMKKEREEMKKEREEREREREENAEMSREDINALRKNTLFEFLKVLFAEWYKIYV